MTTVLDIQRFKDEGRRFAMLTAYDYTTARLLDAAGIPVLLVGDSLGMVMLGHPTTLPVTLDEMLHHARAVVRGAGSALVVGDLPFGTYHVSEEQAIESASRFLKEGGVHAVKLEGGGRIVAITRRLVGMGIPVMSHLGLTPQFVNQFGGFKVQGKSPEAAARILADAKALEAAGAFCLVLEGVPADLARRVTQALRIPTIGIGAGAGCDAQVLVTPDMLGLTTDHTPKFVKRYADLGKAVTEAARAYADDVTEGRFPGLEHSYGVQRPRLLPDQDEVKYGGG